MFDLIVLLRATTLRKHVGRRHWHGTNSPIRKKLGISHLTPFNKFKSFSFLSQITIKHTLSKDKLYKYVVNISLIATKSMKNVAKGSLINMKIVLPNTFNLQSKFWIEASFIPIGYG